MADIIKVTTGTKTATGKSTSYHSVLFIDRNAEVAEEDIELLKSTGVQVVLVNGNPHAVVSNLTTCRY